MNTRMVSAVIVGLGNPGNEYEQTRHNAGRVLLEEFRDSHFFPHWKHNKTANSLVSKGTVEETQVSLVLPETYMNDSGRAIASMIKHIDDTRHLIVVHDDIDLLLGTWKISFDRGSGGHNGIKSISETLKTNAFIRIRIGVLPHGSLDEDRPRGRDAVASLVLGKFAQSERVLLQKVHADILTALPLMLRDGYVKAMELYN